MLENEKYRMLWNFSIQIDQEVEHPRPNISVIDKENAECKIISIAALGDQNIKVNELEKTI